MQVFAGQKKNKKLFVANDESSIMLAKSFSSAHLSLLLQQIASWKRRVEVEIAY